MLLGRNDPRSAIYVDLNTLTITLFNGTVLPITNLLDDEGDECGPDEAIVAVGGSDEAGWWTVPLEGLGEKEKLN